MRRRVFRWTAATGMVALGDLPGGSFTSFGFGVSADGSVIVARGSSASGPEAFRWTQAGGMVGLGDLPGGAFGSLATDVSADGSVVVGRGPRAVSDDGSVVAGRFGNEAYVWDATHGARSIQDLLEGGGLDLTGWALIEATDVSADGRTFVGFGTSPSSSPGFFEAWVAVVPGPPPAALVLLGLLAAAPRLHRGVRARRERR